MAFCLLGRYGITDHAIEQYDDRVHKRRADTVRCIQKDLRTLNIKNIVYNGNTTHVFTKGYKEFIFVRGKDGLYLKTVIKRNRQDTEWKLKRRKKQACYI